jgi:feruloyl esterase
MRLISVVACCGFLIAALATTRALGATTCEDLASFCAANVTITRAASVDTLSAVSSTLAQASLSTSFCRVTGFIAPSSDSHIGFEVWLPPIHGRKHRNR